MIVAPFNTEAPDEDARRAFWRDRLEAAARMLEQTRLHPVRECGEPLAALPEAARAAGVDVHFSTSPIAGALPRLFYLRAGLIASFVAAARAMNARGWILRVEDGYRTRAMQTTVARKEAIFDTVYRRVVWECGGRRPTPALMLRRLTAMVVTVPKIGTHMSASAMDISVLERGSGVEVDRGGPYLEISERTPMDSPFISAVARCNREAITTLMRDHGFVTYPYEFWHYSQGDVYECVLNGLPEPARYGAVDWDPATGSVTPIAEPLALLHRMEDIESAMEQAEARLRASGA